MVDVVLFAAASLFSTLDSSAGLLEHISFFFLLLLVWMMCDGFDTASLRDFSVAVLGCILIIIKSV